MTYNSNVRQTAVAIGAEVPSRSAWRASRLAWALAVISILVAVTSLITAVNQAAISGDYSTILSHQTLTPFTTIGFAVVGALIASRHSRNPIGWIFISVSILYALVASAAALLINRPASSPVFVWAAWFGSWLWIPAILLPSTFVLLVFPDGHLPAPGWRVVAWSAALGMALVLLVTMFYSGPNADLGRVVNPAGIQGAEPILDVLNYLATGLLAVGVIGSLAAYFVRFRLSRGNEREQMKWLVYAVGVYLLLGILSTVAWLAFPASRWMQEVSIALTDLGIFGIAAAAAIAILRHQLYDIDLIINRTLVYTALTAGVAALYGLVVGGLGALFQARSSLLVSLLATGLAAILIQPLRDRLQRFVNRLMYGERDDPYVVLSGLSRRLESSAGPRGCPPHGGGDDRPGAQAAVCCHRSETGRRFRNRSQLRYPRRATHPAAFDLPG